MEFPSLPKFFTSRHAYGRLYDTTSPPSYSSDINAVKLSFKSLFSQKFRWRHIMKSLDEKFLIICSESGNVTKLEKILRKKRSNMSDQTLIDGYHIVTYCGYYETVRYFLEDLKIPINVRTKDGHTALHLACMRNHMDLVTYLCHHGADVNAITCEGATPMHWASFKGYYECVKYLIEKTSASPLAVTNAGFTALHYACSSESGEAGNIHIAKILYDYGVPIDCINEDGDTPLHFVSFVGNQMMMKFLINSGNANIRVKDRAGYTPLHVASARGHTKCVQLLLTVPSPSTHPKGSLIFEFDDHKSSPLHLACRENHPDCVTVILQYLLGNAPSYCSEYLHYYNKEGLTCLHLAAAHNAVRAIGLLLSEYRQWITVDVLDRDGNTPLHTAVSRGHLDTVKLLIESFEANKFALNSRGESPVYVACLSGFGRIVQYLVHAGVELHQQTYSGLTPLHAACSKGHSQIVQYLIQQEGIERENTGDIHNSSPLIVSASNGHLPLVEYLLDRAMTSLFTTDVHGRTSLHHACQNGHIKVASYLIEFALSSQFTIQFLTLKDKDGKEAAELSVSEEIDQILEKARRRILNG